MPEILGVRFNEVSLKEVLEKAKKAVEAKKKLQIITLNTEMIITAQNDSEFAQIIENSGLVVPESSGLQIAWDYNLGLPENESKFKKVWRLVKTGFRRVSGGENHLEIIPGVDLVVNLAKMCAERDFKLFLLGGASAVADEAAAKLRAQFPQLKAKALSGGSFKRDFDQELVEKINSWGPDIILVALGHPRQDKWIATHLQKLSAQVAVGVGGSFDFISGRVPRAPQTIRKMGLEWFFRLIIQPSRAGRQLSLFRFLKLLVEK